VPAVGAGLLEVREARVTFRHPLVRSAVYQAASVAQRAAAHAALADVLSDQPDREVWHRAAATQEPDETTAARMEEVAARAVRRGAIPAAVDAFELAAALTPSPEVRGARLVEAAELAVDTGRRDQLDRVAAAAGSLPLRARDLRRLTSIIMTMNVGGDVPAGRYPVFVELADQSRLDGDDAWLGGCSMPGLLGAGTIPTCDCPDW